MIDLRNEYTRGQKQEVQPKQWVRQPGCYFLPSWLSGQVCCVFGSPCCGVRVPITPRGQWWAISNLFPPQLTWRKLMPAVCFSGNVGVCFRKWDYLLTWPGCQFLLQPPILLGKTTGNDSIRSKTGALWDPPLLSFRMPPWPFSHHPQKTLKPFRSFQN